MIDLVISALERQIRLETAWIEERDMMLASKNDIYWQGKKIPIVNPEYLKQLIKAVEILKKETNNV